MLTPRKTRLAALWCAAAPFLACAADGSRIGAGEAAEVGELSYSGPLCPNCVSGGGETGDFPGGGMAAPNPCPQRSIAADEGLVLPSGLSARAAIELVQREVRLPATWRETVTSHSFAGYARKTSGFAAQTDVSLQIQVTGVSRLELIDDAEHPHDRATEAGCGGIDLTADVALTAGDGSVSGTFSGAIVHVYSETEATLETAGDIGQFTGSLQLGAREGDSLKALFLVSFDGERVRGVLMPIMQSPLETGEGSEDGVAPDYRPLELHWPGTDTCSFDSFPYTGGAASERAEPVVAQYGSLESYTAVYFEPTSYFSDPQPLGTTQMSVEVGSPSLVCQGRSSFGRSPLQHQQLQLPVHFVSSDGRYDVSVPLDVFALVSAEQSFVGTAQFESGPLPASEFSARLGIGPLPLGSAECASLSVSYDVLAPNGYNRRFEIVAGRCGDSRLIDGRLIELLGTGTE